MSGGHVRVAQEHSDPTELYLLYVGEPSDAVTDLVDRARRESWFDRVLAIDPGSEGLDAVEALVDEHGLSAGSYRQGLVVVWDLDSLTEAVEDKQVDNRVLAVSGFLEEATRWAADHVAFGLTAQADTVGFLELTDYFGHDVAAIGDVARCEEQLLAWSRTVPEGDGLGLRGPFEKSPSEWLRSIRHDYLNNGVRSLKVSPLVEGSSLATPHVEVDFWQHHLRNLLTDPRRHCSYRSFTDGEWGEPEVCRRYGEVELKVLAPQWLTDAAECDSRDDGRIQGFRGADDLRSRALSFLEAGAAVVLLWDVDQGDEPPRVPGFDGGAATAPVVLVGADESPRLGWRRWQELLGRNVVGGFSGEELLAPCLGRRGGDRLLDVKPSTWRAFCLGSPLEAVTSIRDLMAETYERFREQLSEDKKKKIYRAMSAVEAARAHYFGPDAASA